MKSINKSTKATKPTTANTLAIGLSNKVYADLQGFAVRANMTIEECFKQAFQEWFDDVAPDAPTPEIFTKLPRGLATEYGRGTWQEGHIAGYLDPEMSRRVTHYCNREQLPLDLLASEAVVSWLFLVAEPRLAA